MSEEQKMYLVQLKVGDYEIKKYVVNETMLQYLQNDLNYDYVKVIKEITMDELNESKIKRKTLKNKENK